MIELIGKGLKRAGPFWRWRLNKLARDQELVHRQVFGGFSGAVLALARAELTQKPERCR